MKKLFLLGLLLTSLASCISDEGGASDPNKTDDEFENPTGSLTDENVQAILDSALHAIQSEYLSSPEDIDPDADIENCSEELDDVTTFIDWECAYEEVSGCIAVGSTIVIDDPELDFINVDYDEFSVECIGEDDFAIHGQINTSKLEETTFCGNIEFTFDSVEKDFNVCKSVASEYSVRLDDKNYIVSDFSIDDTCSTLTATVEDENASDKVECTITSAPDICTDVDEIETIENCSVN